MSWDVYLAINTGIKDCMVEDVRNVTYNNGKIFRKALGGEGLGGLEGKNTSDALDSIRKAIEDIEANMGLYKELEPPNGWGGISDALDFLNKLYKDCKKHPLAKIKIV